MSRRIFTSFFLFARKILLLQSLARYDQKEVLRFRDAQLVAVVNDENAADEQLDNARHSSWHLTMK